MENNTEKRTDNFGRMKAMDYRDMATFLCSQGWQLVLSRIMRKLVCRLWLDEVSRQ